jgi:hypothetical protein
MRSKDPLRGHATIGGMVTTSLPGHDENNCIDYPVNITLAALAPGHKLIVRGICIDIEDRLWLFYAWVPGISAPQGHESGVALNVEYGADVPPSDLDFVGSYSTDGGAASEGELGFSRPPRDARLIWFDFFAADDPEGDHKVNRLTLDLATGEAHVDDAS